MCKATKIAPPARRQQQPKPIVPSRSMDDRKAIRDATVADGSKIRSRFLDRLGISPSPPTTMKQGPRVPRDSAVALSSSPLVRANSNSSASSTSSSNSSRQCPAQQELLKKDYGEPDESLGLNSLSKASYSPRTQRILLRKRASPIQQPQQAEEPKVVKFANAVEVVPVASHRDYSNRIKNTVWTNSAEMKQNYARNVLEFTAENWDYRQVVEEDQFCVSAHGKERFLVHPVHFYLQQQQRERNLRMYSFCAVMSAQTA